MASYTQIDNWLPESDEVLGMSDVLGVTRANIIGGLMLFWRQVNRDATRVGKTDDMQMPSSAKAIDLRVQIPGFAKAMPECWLVLQPDGGCIIPGYWPRCNQKRKKAEAERKAAQRLERANVPRDNTGQGRDKSPNPNPNPSSNPKQRISSAGADAPAKKPVPKQDKKPRKANPIWDALVPLFFPSGVSASDAKRLGAACRDLKAKNDVTPDEIRTRHAEVKSREWTSISIEGFVRDWDMLAPEPKPEPVDMERFYNPDGSLKG